MIELEVLKSEQMSKILFDFVLNEDEKIVITSKEDHSYIDVNYEIDIRFHIESRKYLLAKDTIKYLMEPFHNLLKKLLK